MQARMLNQKPLIGAKNRPRRSSWKKSSVSPWAHKKKPRLKVRCASGQTLPGQYYDQETNLHYNHFRYYDPALGRFITSDPIGIYVGLNTYSYASMNPLAGFDMFGLEDNKHPRHELMDNIMDQHHGETTQDLDRTDYDAVFGDGKLEKGLNEGAPIAEKALTRGLDKIAGDAKKELKKKLDLKKPELKEKVLGEATKKNLERMKEYEKNKKIVDDWIKEQEQKKKEAEENDPGGEDDEEDEELGFCPIPRDN